MKRLVCIEAFNCEDGKNRIACTTEERLNDQLVDLKDFCVAPKIISKDIDTVEIVTTKGELKTEYKSNRTEFLTIENK